MVPRSVHCICAVGPALLAGLAGCEEIVSEQPGTTTAAATSSGATAGATASSTSSGSATTSGMSTATGASSGIAAGGTSSGTASVCGNGVVEPGEVCDLGVQNGQGVGCNATCNLLGLVTTIAGNGSPELTDGFGAAARFGRPYGLAVEGNMLYVADTSFAAVRAVELENGDYVQTLAGGHADAGCIDGDGLSTDPNSGFCEPDALLPFDGGLLITDFGALRFLSFSATFDGGALSTFGGTRAIDGTEAFGFDAGPIDAMGACIYGDPKGMALVFPELFTNTAAIGIVAETRLDHSPADLEPVGSIGPIVQQGGMTALNGRVYTSDTGDPGGLYSYDPATGTLGSGLDAGFALTPALQSPDGLCTDGRSIYICETGTSEIRQYDPMTGTLTVLAGSPANQGPTQADGLGSQAGFFDPAGCAWDPVREVLYVADRAGNEIRVIQ